MFASLLDQYSKELGEFVSTVREDTVSALETAKKKLLSEEEEEEEEDEHDDSIESIMQTKQLGGAYSDFYSSVDLSSQDLDELRTKYSELLATFVPGQLAEEEFFCRVLYFQHLERRARLLAGTPSMNEDDEDLSWGDDDDEDDGSILSEPDLKTQVEELKKQLLQVTESEKALKKQVEELKKQLSMV